jgi:hypothetical protein
MKDVLAVEKGGYRDSWKEETSQTLIQLFLPCMGGITPCGI